MKLNIVASNRFRKDLKIAKKRGLNLKSLEIVVEKLSNLTPLEDKYRDHALAGKYCQFRECHIEPDWLLIYRQEAEDLNLLLFRTGTHSDLF